MYSWSLVVLMCVASSHGVTHTVMEGIMQNPELSEFTSLIQSVNLTVELNNYTTGITIFAPSNAAMLRATLPTTETEKRRLVEYHVVRDQNLTTADFQHNMRLQVTRTLETIGYLWFNVKNNSDIFVNDGLITAQNIQEIDGHYHIIDSVLMPPESDASTGGVIATDTSYSRLQSLLTKVPEVANMLNNDSLIFTMFAPTDLAIPMEADSETETELSLILRSHIIEGEVLFDHCLVHADSTMASEGRITIKEKPDGRVFVTNGYGIKAEIVETNYPTSNGVIHRINNMIGYVWMDTFETIAGKDKLSEFEAKLTNTGIDLQLQSETKTFTVFAPTNDAFETFMRANPNITSAELKTILNNHIVENRQIYASDMTKSAETTNVNGKTLRFNTTMTDLFVMMGGFQSEILYTDMESTNGVLHVIDTVLSGASVVTSSLLALLAVILLKLF